MNLNDTRAGDASKVSALGPLRRVRWALTLLPLAMAAILIATLISNHAGVRQVLDAAAVLILILGALLFHRLSHRAERLEEHLERDRRLAALGEMAAVLAHEIRNPLASIKGHAQLLAEALPVDSREGKKADRVVRETLRLERLIQDLLAFVRSKKIERTDADPASVLRLAAEQVDTALPGTALFVIDVERSPASWSLDAGLLQLALVNLLRNGAQAVKEARLESSAAGLVPIDPDDGSAPLVQASISVDDDHLVYTVRDTGRGLPAQGIETLFEPFHTGRLQGTGLGLAVARQIVDLHGGTIEASNHPDGGAVFTLRLPST